MWRSLARNLLWKAATSAAREQPRAAPAQSADSPPPPHADPPVCHVGLVYALGIEAGGMIDRLQGVVRTCGDGFTVDEGGLGGRRIVVVESGPGRASAARAVDALIWGHRPRWVISAGFAGGLDARLAQGDILLADEIVDAAGAGCRIDLRIDPASLAATAGVHVGRLLTVDRIVRTAEEKRTLGQTYRALAVDLESLAVAQVCQTHKTRLMSVRVISDAVDRELPKDVEHLMVQKSWAGKFGAAAGAVFRRPSSVKDFWQLKEDALVASERLAKFLVGVIEQITSAERETRSAE